MREPAALLSGSQLTKTVTKCQQWRPEERRWPRPPRAAAARPRGERRARAPRKRAARQRAAPRAALRAEAARRHVRTAGRGTGPARPNSGSWLHCVRHAGSWGRSRSPPPPAATRGLPRSRRGAAPRHELESGSARTATVRGRNAHRGERRETDHAAPAACAAAAEARRVRRMSSCTRTPVSSCSNSLVVGAAPSSPASSLQSIFRRLVLRLKSTLFAQK